MSVEIIERTSEEQWLEARRSRITATDIGRLAKGGPSIWATVKAEKLGAERRRFTTPYMDWGNEREPVIVSHLTFLYGIEPNQDLYVNGTRSATPDGISDDALAEVKTTIRLWDDLAEVRRVKPEYYDQVQWAQLVCEREKTWFAYEHNDGFVPGEVKHFEIVHDPVRIAELLVVEQEFKEYLEADDVAGEWDEFMARYHEAHVAFEQARVDVETLKQELRDKLGDTELAVKTPFGSISYSKPKDRQMFDQAAFKKANEELFEQFTKLVPAKAPTLRITPKGN